MFFQGMTIRMSIALGLHAESNRFDFTERYTRRHIWLVFYLFALIIIGHTKLTFLIGGPWHGKIAISHSLMTARPP
jgi:hypothetical protein